MSNKAFSGDPTMTRQVGFFSRIQTKMILYFGLLFIILLTVVHMVEFYGVPFTGFQGEYRERESEVFRKLSFVADMKKENLLYWIEERFDDMDVLAESNLIRRSVGTIIEAGGLGEAKNTGRAEFLQAVKENSAYQNLNSHLALIKKAYGVYQVIEIIDPQTAITMATTHHVHHGDEKMYHKKIIADIKFPRDLSIDVAKDFPRKGEFTLIMARGIEITGYEKTRMAILVFHVNLDDFIQPLLHTGGGLGATGEALLINEHRKILVPLKYPLADGTGAVPLEHEISSRPALLAARGEEGIIISEDYRGVPVLAAFRHISITPEMGWGMVVKRDLADVYAPLWKSRRYTAMVGWIGTIFALILIGMISNKLTRPMQLMAQTARQVEAGDLTARAPVIQKDEMGMLTRVFNSMVNRVERWKEELEEEVENRTQQLNASNQQLRASEQQLKASQQQLRASNQQLRASEQQLKANGQQLRASIQQLHASEQQLKASQQQLRASNQQLRAANQQLHSEIDERKILQQQVIQTEKMTSLGEMGAGIAHELNTPLSVILGYQELMLKKIDTCPSFKEYLQISVEEVELCRDIIKNFLIYARPSNEITPDEPTVNIKEIFANVHQLMAHKQEKNIKFKMDIAKDMPLINGNQKQLMQVFINIINNAIDAMPDGGVIHVSAQCIHNGGAKKERCIEVCIMDSGSGISEEYLSKVFDPFFTSKRPGKGTGLGLAICLRIVENHKGKISIESIANKGTKVTCHLPLPA